MKCLIAVSPNGAACFVSDLYEGNIDDVEIFRQCGTHQSWWSPLGWQRVYSSTPIVGKTSYNRNTSISWKPSQIHKGRTSVNLTNCKG